MSEVANISDIFSLACEGGEATYLATNELIARKERIQGTYSAHGLEKLKKLLDQFINVENELTALKFYLAFEQASLLVLLHGLPRRGERNRHANGLQQTYGDHIRLMMLGFDMYDRSDIEWLMKRRWPDPLDVAQADLEDSIRRYHNLNLTRSERAAIWIASALHDFGKILGRGYGLDAEDAASLCNNLVETLSPEGMQEFIHYGIRNHDLIEHTVTGDTPACFIKDPIKDLSENLRARALPMLALIQQIGAASLGEGRLTKAKLDIYNACLSGGIVDDESVESRLGRLLFGRQAVPESKTKEQAGTILASIPEADQATLKTLLDRTVVLGWNSVRGKIVHEEPDEDSAIPRLIRALVLIGELWNQSPGPPTHVVLARPSELAKLTDARKEICVRSENNDVVTKLLNGTSALILR